MRYFQYAIILIGLVNMTMLTAIIYQNAQQSRSMTDHHFAIMNDSNEILKQCEPVQ